MSDCFNRAFASLHFVVDYPIDNTQQCDSYECGIGIVAETSSAYTMMVGWVVITIISYIIMAKAVNPVLRIAAFIKETTENKFRKNGAE